MQVQRQNLFKMLASSLVEYLIGFWHLYPLLMLPYAVEKSSRHIVKSIGYILEHAFFFFFFFLFTFLLSIVEIVIIIIIISAMLLFFFYLL